MIFWSDTSLFGRHCVAVYFVFVFLISWIGSFVVVGPKFLQGQAIEFSDIGLMGLAMLCAPFIGGLLMTFLVDGKRGLGELFGRIKMWNVGGRWYLPLFVFPSLLLIVSSLLSVFVSAELAPTFFALGIALGVFAGLLEEIGWTGFAFPKMTLKMSVL